MHFVYKFTPEFGIVLDSVIFILWGVWLVLPWDTYAFNPQLLSLSYFGPDYVLGSASLLIASMKLWGVFHDKKKFVKNAAMLGFMFWVLIAWSVAKYDWRAIGMTVYPSLALWNAWTWMMYKWAEE